MTVGAPDRTRARAVSWHDPTAGRAAYAQGEVRDGADRLAAHAVGNFFVVGGG